MPKPRINIILPHNRLSFACNAGRSSRIARGGAASRLRIATLSLGTLVGVLGCCLAQAAPGVLRDQNGNARGLQDHAGVVQVAIVVSAKRLRRIKPWERSLAESFESVPLLRVADVPRTAPTEYEAVAEKLRKRLPEGVDVLVDLEGVWADSYDLDVSKPSILIFDQTGTLLAVHHGMYKDKRFAGVRADLERVLASTTVSTALSDDAGDAPTGEAAAEQ